VLQLRQKGLDSGAMLAAALSLVPICRKHGVPLIINDRVDIALASDADGVHVGQVVGLLPLYCLFTASLLPLYCLFTASLLPLCCLFAASLLPLCCLFAASLLPQATPMACMSARYAPLSY
jgi:hypothetical protein